MQSDQLTRLTWRKETPEKVYGLSDDFTRTFRAKTFRFIQKKPDRLKKSAKNIRTNEFERYNNYD